MLALEIQDLRVDYGDFTAVSQLSLSVAKGEIYGLVGPNGAGKTSTLNVLATLLSPTYGHVHVCGIDIDLDPQGARAKMGYMPDLAPVIKNLQVWEFLDLFAGCHGLRGAAKTRRVNDCLELVKMQDSAKSLCGTLSRGMTQRVVLAKTFLHRPELLLLDEPASGMDPIARIDLKDALQAMAAEGATIVLSSHILSELAELVGSIGILHKGELRRHGPVSDVLESLQQRKAIITVGMVDDPQPCQQWLAAIKLQAAVDPRRPRSLSFSFSGSESEQAALLAQMVAAGHAISSFHAKSSSLEDVLREISAEDTSPQLN